MTLWDFTRAFDEALQVLRPVQLDGPALRFVLTDPRLPEVRTLGVRFDPITLTVFHQTGKVWILSMSPQAALRLGLTPAQALDYIDASDDPAHVREALRARIRPIHEVLRVTAFTALHTPQDTR